MRRVTGASALFALVAYAALTAPEAAAAPPRAALTAADTLTFSLPGEHTYTVPAGVTRVDVSVVGGEGARGGNHGGRAAWVKATLDVTPGQTLYAVVGSSASGSTPGQNGGGAAGGPGGVCANTPGAGGGASDVRTIAPGQPGSDESRIVVAGGGGGAGSRGATADIPVAPNTYGGHRGLGGGTATLGGWGGAGGVGGQGGNSDDSTDGTSTAGGRGAVGDPGAGRGCGGGGGGGYGGGGAGAISSADESGGGGGGGGSLVPEGFPAGMAAHGDHPSVTFRSPGLPAPAGPLAITTVATLQQNNQGDGVVPFTNCPSSCIWLNGNMGGLGPGDFGADFGYASTQRWGTGGLQDQEFSQASASIKPGPAGAAADLGTPFLLMNFLHNNYPIRGDSPTILALQTLLTVQPPSGSPAVFRLRGGQSIPLNFLETDNGGVCDPKYQKSSTPCDDSWELAPYTAAATASGVTWHFELLGWRTPEGTFDRQISTEEQTFAQQDIYAQVTVDTNPTTSSLTADGADPVLRLTTEPVPQTGGTVTFTDGSEPIADCTDIAVDTSDGVTTCSPTNSAPGSHTFGASFSGGIGFGPSAAAPVDHSVLQSQSVTFIAPTDAAYGDADSPLGATASSGLDVTYASSTPNVCAVSAAGVLAVVSAGTCTVTASQAGNSTYSPAEQARTFSIGKATLTVTADDKSRPFGAANPTLTATTTGFVNADSDTVVSGTATLTTDATTSSPPGDYPINISVEGLSASNYEFEGATGNLTVQSDAVGGLAPEIEGTPHEGQTLTAIPGPVVPSDATLAYQWERSGTPISGATKRTHKLKRLDAGRRLSVTITASSPGRTSQTATSPLTPLVSSRHGRMILSSSTVTKGTTFDLIATGLKPGQTYTIWLGGKRAYTGIADANGMVIREIEFPSSVKTGTRRVRVSGYVKNKRTFTIYTHVKYVNQPAERP